MHLPQILSASQPLSPRTWFVQVATPPYWRLARRSVLMIVQAKGI